MKLGVVFVVDDSGSNVEEPTDPNYLRAAAVRVALSYLPNGTVVAAERFAGGADEIFPPQVLTSANRGSLSTRVRSSLESSGNTDYDAAFAGANSLLQRIQGVDRKVVIFLSDGMPTFSYSEDEAIAAQHIPIFTVGYGNASQNELEGIASRSGGLSFQIGTVSDAISHFAQIVNPLICNAPKVDVGVRVGAGETRTVRFFVPRNTPGFSALVTWDTGNPGITIRRPNGSTLKPGPQVTIDRSTPNALRVDVGSPASGTWTLVIVADRTSNVSVHFNLWTTPKPQPTGGCTKSVTAGQAVLSAGCWRRVGPRRYRATGDFRINGIAVAGAGDVEVDLDELRLTAGARTWFVNAVPIAAGRLSIALDQTIHVGATGSLHGLRLTGDVAIELNKGSKTVVSAHVALPIPGHTLDLSGDVRFTVDGSGRANLDNLHVKGEGEVPFGGFRLRNVELSYVAAGDVWRGGAVVFLETVNVEAAGSATFKSGAFAGASAAARGRVPLGSGFYLDGVRVQIEFSPRVHLLGGASVSFGPKSLLQGDLALNFWPLYLWQADGVVKVAESLLKPIGAHASMNGTVAVHTERGVQADLGGTIDVGLAQPPLGVRGSVSGYAAASAFNIEGTTSTSFGLEMRAIVSSTGVAGCARTKLSFGGGFGFHYRWGERVPYVGGCQVDSFRVARPAFVGLLVGSGAASSTVDVPPNVPYEMFTAESAGGVPNVVLRGPRGEVIDSRQGTLVDRPDLFVLHYPGLHRTFIAVPRPSAGAWRIDPAPGGPALTQTIAADGLPPLAIHATVRGRGERRVLRYSVGALRGRTVSFFQSHGSAPGALPILRGAKRAGSIAFRPERGLGSLRFVTAIVSKDGVPIESRPVAFYRVRPPARPTRVSRFAVARSRRTLVVRWGGAGRAVAWRVQIQSSDGRRFIRTLPVSHRVFRLGARPGAKIFVSVAGVDRFGRAGARATRISVFHAPRR